MPCTNVHAAGSGPLCAGAQPTSAGELADIAGDLAAAGYQGIELHPHHLAELTEDPRRGQTLRDALDAASLRVGAVYGGVPADPASVSLVRGRMELAAEFGADVVFVVPPSRRDFTLAQTAERMRELGRSASELGVTLAVHHHAGTAVTTVAESLALLERVDAPGVGLCLDVAHLALFEDHLSEAIARLLPATAYVHLKDLEGWARTRLGELQGDTLQEVAALGSAYTDLGAGALDLPALAGALRAVGPVWTAIEMETLRAPTVLEQCTRNAAAYRELVGESTARSPVR
jgi:sugar phosphate isomerase/epimerase